MPTNSLEKPEEDLDKLLKSMNIELVSVLQVCLHSGKSGLHMQGDKRLYLRGCSRLSLSAHKGSPAHRDQSVC